MGKELVKFSFSFDGILLSGVEVFTGQKYSLEATDISVKGLFMNADAGFDSKEFRDCCQNKEINANIYSRDFIFKLLCS